MANSYTDPRIVAVLFTENNLSDQKGGNDLSDHGSITFDGADQKAGNYSADFERDAAQYADRADADLDAGFPFKSGETNKKASLAVWLKWESEGSFGNVMEILGKGESGKYCARLWYYNYWDGQLRFSWGAAGGGSAAIYSLFGYESTNGIKTGRWYHLGLAIDGGPNKQLYYQVWDDFQGLYVSKGIIALDNEANIEDGIFYAGGVAASNNFDGKINELIIANDLFSPMDLDRLRQGTFSGQDEIGVAQVFAQAEWQAAPFVEVSQAFTQVEWQAAPFIKVPQAFAQAEYVPLGTGLHAFQHLAQVEYSLVTGPSAKRIFPVPPPGRLLQTQAGKRKFPVVV